MMDPNLELVQRYRSRGVLVDTNILLLYFVGRFKRQQIPHFKRTAQFAVGDYDLLDGFLSAFKRVVTTPNILSEVNSLSGQMGEPDRRQYFEEFAREIATLDERYVPSVGVSGTEAFQRVGLTDSGIMHLARDGFLVLSDDLKLCGYLEKVGVDVLNFNHLRFIVWAG
ncbi:MAG: hypothetical protein A2V70_01530 [Planctomycetes bacterium RBG_13_63_9]|nr:MAG: hypothetical protein A2V70_01530 [Planctomycetes bacterium RBG_13_63_9]